MDSFFRSQTFLVILYKYKRARFMDFNTLAIKIVEISMQLWNSLPGP